MVVAPAVGAALPHGHYLLLDAVMTLPVAVVAGLAASRWPRQLPPRWRLPAFAVVFTALLVPLGMVQPYAHQLVGGAAGHQHPGGGVAALAIASAVAALAAWPVVLLTALGGGWLIRACGDRRSRRRTLHRLRAARRPLVSVAAGGALLAGVGAAAFLPASPALAQPNGCDTAPQRTYDVAAIDVEITVNRFGDNDPFGYMYVLERNLNAVRAEEAALRRGGELGAIPGGIDHDWPDLVAADPAADQVTPGLRDDLIQPLVVRARLGECIIFKMRNAVQRAPVSGPNNNTMFRFPSGAPRVSIDLQGVAYHPQGGQGGQQVGQTAATMANPGQIVEYKYFLDPAMGEGTRVFRSGGESTQLTAHGLFGAVIVEAPNARWYDPVTGEEQTGTQWSNWEAMVAPGGGNPTFREFALLYHEIGDEDFNLRRPRREGSAVIPGFPEYGEVGNPLPMVDGGPNVDNPTGSGANTSAYRPGSRALNYRAESFYRRLQLETVLVAEAGGDNADATQAQKDNKSLAYSSYTYGDPATPIPRSYLGEPTKTRLAHVGFEQLHVHHLHGGATRWRQNPDADDTDMAGGLRKVPIQNANSIRLDSQTISPEEAFTLEHECGAGGCQQAAGDFLYHCHVAHHYIAGMWGLWRVFDTAQDGLAPLPGANAPPAGVTSAQLLGTTLDDGRTVVLDAEVADPATQAGLETLVESQLPPQGQRWDLGGGELDPQDATVWDWLRTGPANAPVYVGEPETDRVWANYRSANPGQRPALRFNPGNGRPAYPLFTPHLAQRPPFSPNQHSGAPWLGDTATAQRPDGLCPSSAEVREFDITAVSVPIAMTHREVDPDGMLYVLNEDKEELLAGDRPTEPLVVRSNVGDCVAITFGNETDHDDLHKANMHTHFVQFDPLASDGVITGYAYEQSVFPAHRDGRELVSVADPTTITVSQVDRLRPGIAVAVGLGTPEIEIRTIEAINGNQLTLDQPLANSHAAGTPVTVEFTQHRWYSDVDSGTVFWHDHVDGIVSWAHGLFAAHIIEPPGSEYRDPQTGDPVRSGTVVDVVNPDGSVGVGQSGPFREFVIFLHNGRPGQSNLALNFGQECEEGSINLRAEPLGERTPPGDTSEASIHTDPDTTDLRLEYNGARCLNAFDRSPPQNPNDGTVPATVTTVDPHVFSSVTYGEPITPLFRAYAGDDVVIRTIGVNERAEGLRIQGHQFRTERFHPDGALQDTAVTGISERFDYVLDGGAGGPQRFAGDYLYHSTRTFALESGAWGIFRVHDRQQGDLVPLPDNAPPAGSGFPVLSPHTAANPQADPGPAPPSSINPNGTVNQSVVSNGSHVCPPTGPVRVYQVTVFDQPLPTTPFGDAEGIVYALNADVAAIRSGQKPVEPLVLRANEGDCVRLRLTNDIDPDSRVGGTRAGVDLGQLLRNPQLAAGSAVGLNPDTTVPIGGTIEYRFRANREVGTTIFQNLGSPASLRHGAYGLLIVEPRNSQWFDSFTGAALGPNRTSTQAVIRVPGQPDFREFALTMQTTDQQYGRSIIPYMDTIAGNGINGPRAANRPSPPVAGAPPGTEQDEGSFNKGFNHINYRTAPLTSRIGLTNAPGPNDSPNWWEPGFTPAAPYHNALSSNLHGDPATPVFRARAGDRVVFRIGIGASDHLHSVTISGHAFPLEPGITGSQLMASRTLTAGQSLDAWLVGGAGGTRAYAGDYAYRDSRQPWTAAGLWGVFRVQVTGSGGIIPL
ncbi:hypothetical protein JQS43_09665 [Natronosporangium hydrolyticum]|uniref:Plastocyanin-like domain-containing protein n=1 Tax=Natronosporangium hydrolyticum TaxID=2811111 RepID=A0A895YKF4_9ACTN|nr:hypothetical protein [Natronosporangium hydrolyticum]QSB16512.1 hypothetical protein JQS43_09665 [Natronosporangium hydrolyticum]